MKIDSLDHLVLTVHDIDATCAFYSKVLGMKIVSIAEVRKALSFGSQQINLHEHGKELDPGTHKPTHGSADLCFITSMPMADILSHLDDCGVG